MGSCIWYSEEGPGWAAASPIPLFTVPNARAHPSTAAVPTLYYSTWHYNYVCTLKGYVVNNDNDDKTVIAIV